VAALQRALAAALADAASARAAAAAAQAEVFALTDLVLRYRPRTEVIALCCDAGWAEVGRACAYLCRDTYRCLPPGLTAEEGARVRASHALWRVVVDAPVSLPTHYCARLPEAREPRRSGDCYWLRNIPHPFHLLHQHPTNWWDHYHRTRSQRLEDADCAAPKGQPATPTLLSWRLATAHLFDDRRPPWFGLYDRVDSIYGSCLNPLTLWRLRELEREHDDSTVIGGTRLHVFARQGVFWRVRDLCCWRASVNTRDARGRTALHFASYAGHAGIVRELLARGAAPFAACVRGETPLHIACRYGYCGIARALIDAYKSLRSSAATGGDGVAQGTLDARDERGATAIFVASQHGHARVVHLLVSAGAALTGTTNSVPFPRVGFAMHVDCALRGRQQWYTSEDEVLRCGIGILSGGTALHAACVGGHTAAVRALLRAGADAEARDEYGATCLHKACSAGQLAVVTKLLDRGADIAARDTAGGRSCLEAAVDADSFDVVLELVARGADVEDRRGGKTLFQRLVWRWVHQGERSTAHQQMIESRMRGLLACGANVDADDELGFTALEAAACNNHPHLATLLLQLGARLYLRGFCKPMMFAILDGHDVVVRALLDAGTRPEEAAEMARLCSAHSASFRSGVGAAVCLMLLGAPESADAPPLPDADGAVEPPAAPAAPGGGGAGPPA